MPQPERFNLPAVGLTRPSGALRAAAALIDFGVRHPARYRVLSDSGLQADGALRAVAFASFKTYSALVARA